MIYKNRVLRVYSFNLWRFFSSFNPILIQIGPLKNLLVPFHAFGDYIG